jgi:superfamily II DNA or RNA helicase
MKCLDEGVDVPRSELAIFCASTGNPRQFIQRRGRVLRLHKDKIHAVIHDLVVVPEVSDENTFEMEKGLIKKELERVVDFANLSMNKTETYKTLKNILEYYNLNLNDL